MDPTPRPRPRDAAASTAHLLAAARSEFAAHGFEGARIDRISAASGFNKALLFQRFGDKEGLYRAVIAQVAEEAVAVRAELVTSRDDPADRAGFATMLRELAAATARFLTDHPDAARILAWERAAGWTAFSAVHEPARDDAAGVVSGWFERAAREGWLRAGPGPARRLDLVLELVAAMLGEDRGFIADAVTAALMKQEAR
ncbi:TetR family transcriptional regulator [Leifsonia sp. F6_8S_P_1B]|uniref:TetR family transcriptional regulator n=1 Tax=Leifsonia williamsii TaxID=3035919 RepID=A0ABT8K9H4_9MICO|nr:TetR/AcrR family transcriptional regulator [Leifsonia williamsii]MDN4614111.1 TetR family transcriptional regulator [Leifsonia williamsii]